mgnify:CR=1 FL=1|jgi:hypothetical protein
MSSQLRIINWKPDQIVPDLNTGQLPSLKPSTAKQNFLPYSQSVARDPSGPHNPMVWGEVNTLIIKPSSGGKTQVYNGLSDPKEAAPNTELLLWVFPEFLVFSQFNKQLGGKIHPS